MTSESQLNQALERSMNASEDTVEWFSTAKRFRGEKPRVVMLEQDGHDASITASAQAGERNVSRSVGSTAGRGTFSVTVDDVPAGLLGEDALHFEPKPTEEGEEEAPDKFLGEAIYHRLQYTASDSVREFIEIRKSTTATMSMGGFSLSRATTWQSAAQDNDERGIARRRKIAYALESEPADTYVGAVKLPDSMKQNPWPKLSIRTPTTAAACTALEKRLRYRIELLESQGEHTRLDKLINTVNTVTETVENAVTSAQAKLDQLTALSERADALAASGESAPEEVQAITQQLSAMAREAGSLGQSVAATGNALTDYYQAAKDKAANQLEALGLESDFLKRTHCSYMRWVRSETVSLEPDPSSVPAGAPHPNYSLKWTPTWTPQVYRGLANYAFKYTANQSVPIIPAVKVFFREKMQFRAESLTFEAIGQGTFTYLKSVFMSFGDNPEKWREYAYLHKGELFDLFEEVAIPGSTAFSEVVRDAMNGPDSACGTAADFGRLCWEFFNRRDNPFLLDGTGGKVREVAVVDALLPPPATSDSRIFAPAQVPGAMAIFDNLGLTVGYLRKGLQAFGLHKPGTRFENPGTHFDLDESTMPESVLQRIGSLVDRRIAIRQTFASELSTQDVSRCTRFEESLKNAVEESLARRTLEVRTLRNELGKVASRLHGTPTLAMRYSVGKNILGLIKEELGCLSVLLELSRTGMFEEQMPDVRTLKEYQTSRDAILKTEYSDVVARQFAGVCVGETYRLMRGPSSVPDKGDWVAKSKRGMPRLSRRTGRTLALDECVARYHATREKLSKENPNDPSMSYLVVLENSLEMANERRLCARILQVEIGEWHALREESKSARSKNTACYLELPCLTDLMAIEWGMLQLGICMRMLVLAEIAEVIHTSMVDYRRARAEHLADARMYMQDYDRYRISSEANSLVNDVQWENKKAQDMSARIDELFEGCSRYLKAFRHNHAFDGLFTGRRKTLPPGRALPVFEVESEPEPEAGDAGTQ